MSRLIDETRRLATRFVTGAGGRRQADEAGAYDAAMKAAFLSPPGLEPAAPRRRPTALRPDATLDDGPAATASTRASAVFTSRDVRPAAPGSAPMLPAVGPAPEPAVAVPATESAPWPVVAASGTQTAPAAPSELVTSERFAHRRRKAGETAPDHLLLPPTNIDSKADDFFDGLIRRVQGDR